MLTKYEDKGHSFHNVEEQGLTVFLFTLAWIDFIHFIWLDYHSYFEPQDFSSYYIDLSILDYHSPFWAGIMLVCCRNELAMPQVYCYFYSTALRNLV